MIEPALTAEEWALLSVATPRDLTVAAANNADRTWEQQAPLIAALCLHGRITWEMVDALRWEAGVLHDPGAGEQHPHLARLLAVADLLESLLPPREL